MESNENVWADWLEQENEDAVGDRKAMEAGGGNAASQIVLEKCGFRPNGTFGEKGPRFTLGRPIDAGETG